MLPEHKAVCQYITEQYGKPIIYKTNKYEMSQEWKYFRVTELNKTLFIVYSVNNIFPWAKIDLTHPQSLQKLLKEIKTKLP